MSIKIFGPGSPYDRYDQVKSQGADRSPQQSGNSTQQLLAQSQQAYKFASDAAVVRFSTAARASSPEKIVTASQAKEVAHEVADRIREGDEDGEGSEAHSPDKLSEAKGSASDAN